MSTAQKLASQTPARSLDQRMEALQRANVIRIARAQLKRDLKSGDASISALLGDPPEWVLTAKVFDLLLAVPKCGRVKAGAVPDDLPDLAVEDGRRAVRAPASRARRAAAPVAHEAPAIAILFVISGPSGAGKGTLIHGVLDRDPDIAAVAVSATTRRQREGEEDGREYYFLSRRRVPAPASTPTRSRSTSRSPAAATAR